MREPRTSSHSAHLPVNDLPTTTQESSSHHRRQFEDFPPYSAVTMYLLHFPTMSLKMISGPSKAPPYVILSHTWSMSDDDSEILFEHWKSELAQQVQEAMSSAVEGIRSKALQKVSGLSKIALELDLEFGWIDTLCIDKRVC